MLHLILFIHVAFLYIPLSISPPSPTLFCLFILCSSKPSGFAVCLDIFRRGCCCSCCCCRRGKYASISFTPCNVVGLTATPDCAPGLLLNYFVNVFLLSFLPLHSSLFSAAAAAAVVHFVRPQKASRIGQVLGPFCRRFRIQVGAALLCH